MAISFRDLKANRKSDFENLQKKIDEQTQGGGGQDKRFWQPTVDKAGNGYAVIRFLPAPGGEGEDVAFVRLFTHAFKGPSGKWYIENSRTTLGSGEKDPVGEMNSRLWNESEDDNSPGRKQARLQKRKLTYISNILVIKDASNPDNEGKVFLYKYGKKIWDKINGAMYPPEIEDTKGFNPFDMWEGANFKLKIRQKDGYRNYDESLFDSPAPISSDDDKLESIWKQEMPLQEFIAADKFKSYDELEKLLHQVLGTGTAPAARAAAATRSEEYSPPARAARPQKAAEAPAADDDGAPWSETEAAGTAELSFFENLAKD